jgi:Tol biopolymer transport system component
MNVFRLLLLLGLIFSDRVHGIAGSDERPFQGKIVLFGSRDDSSSLIQTMSPDGKGLKTVLKLEEGIVSGRVSPDGRQLAFSLNPTGSKRLEVWLLNAGGVRRKIADRGFVRAWSPDGGKIACYAPAQKGGWESFTVSVATNEIRPLPIPKTDAVEDWSPDGRLLSVMAGNVEKTFRHSTKGTYPLRQIYLMKVDGSERQMLTPESFYDSIWSRFSPDGTRVAHYRREHPNDRQSPFESLVIRQRDGSHPTKVLNFAEYVDEQISVRPYGFPSWSPDGRSLVWIADRRRRDRRDLVPGKRIEYDLFFVSIENRTARMVVLDQKGINRWGQLDWR